MKLVMKEDVVLDEDLELKVVVLEADPVLLEEDPMVPVKDPKVPIVSLKEDFVMATVVLE